MEKKNTYNLKIMIGIAILMEFIFWPIFYFILKFLEQQDDFKLENKFMLWGFLLIPVFAITTFLFLNWKNRAKKRYSSANLLNKLTSKSSTLRATLKYLLVRNAIAMFIIAGCNPQYGKSMKDQKIKGIEIMIALDVSKSMLAKDLDDKSKPFKTQKDRLQIAKRAIKQLLNKLGGDRVGIVAFTSTAYKEVPLTNDYSIVKLHLDAMHTDMMSVQGTNIGNAIKESVSSFNLKTGTNKAIIVISDGEDHEKMAELEANNAADKGIKIFTIGMGTPQGAVIPEYDRNGVKRGNKRDQNGKTVLIKLNETMLQNIANSGSGTYTKATATNLGLNQIVEDLNNIEKSEYGEKEFLSYDNQYQWFLAIGLLLLVIDMLILLKRNSLADKLNLFGNE